MTENPTFTPRDGSPTIHVNVRQNKNNNGGGDGDDDDDVVARMWKEHKAEEMDAQQQEASGESHGRTVYDLSARTTVEYDVVACADFVEDKGCWVRNMPEEIRLANPDFVPT